MELVIFQNTIVRVETREKSQGGGAFFLACLICKSKKKPQHFGILNFPVEITYVGIIEMWGGAFF